MHGYHARKTDILEAFVELSKWISTMGHRVRVVCMDAESVFVHGAFAQHCAVPVKVSHSAIYLKETSGQVERYFGGIMDVTLALLKTPDTPHKYWPLPVKHTTSRNESPHNHWKADPPKSWCMESCLTLAISV